MQKPIVKATDSLPNPLSIVPGENWYVQNKVLFEAHALRKLRIQVWK